MVSKRAQDCKLKMLKRKTAEAYLIFILSSFTFLSLGVPYLSLTCSSFMKNTDEVSGGGAAAGAAAPPPEKKIFFIFEKKPFSKILFRLDSEN
jgi:hypothetical protein